MAKIRLKAEIGIARHMPGGRSEMTVDVGAGDTVSDVLGRLGVPEQAVSLILVNKSAVKADAVVEDGDEVSLLPFIVGG